MAFVSALIGIIIASGLGDWIAHGLTPLAGSSIKDDDWLYLLIPLLSPAFLGPGADCSGYWCACGGSNWVRQYSPALALPALFAINAPP